MMWLLVAVSMALPADAPVNRIGLLTTSKEQCESIAAVGNRGVFDSMPAGPMAFFCYQVRE